MSSSTPTRRRRRPLESTRAFARLTTQRHSPLVWRMRCTLSNIGDLARDVVADQRLHARHVVAVHEPAPVGRDVRVVLVVAEHLAPARREVDRVVLDVEVPQAVVGATAATGRCAPRAATGSAARAAARARSRSSRRRASAAGAGWRPSRRAAASEHSAMKPETRPRSEKPQISIERMPSSANRAASAASSRRGASVSRISRMRRWSRPFAR